MGGCDDRTARQHQPIQLQVQPRAFRDQSANVRLATAPKPTSTPTHLQAITPVKMSHPIKRPALSNSINRSPHVQTFQKALKPAAILLATIGLAHSASAKADLDKGRERSSRFKTEICLTPDGDHL